MATLCILRYAIASAFCITMQIIIGACPIPPNAYESPACAQAMKPARMLPRRWVSRFQPILAMKTAAGAIQPRKRLCMPGIKVREQWLLYGTGDGPGQNGDQNAEIINILDHLPPLKKAEAIGYLRGLANSGD